MCNYLDTHFYVILDDFGGISPMDPLAFDNSAVETWMADSTSDFCMLCHSQFNPVVRRRHHCRCCGLLFCKACTNNRTMVGDSVVRVCDACAVILIPPSPSYSYWGLKRWCSNHNCFSVFETAPKSAGIRYLCSMLESECVPAHFNASRTLYKLSRYHSPAMIENGVAKSLLRHSLTCQCESTALTLALFVILYFACNEGCSIDFSEFPDLDCVKLIEKSEGEMKRSAARLLYVLCHRRVIPVPDVSGILKSCDDPWVVAFVIATLAIEYNSGSLGDLQNQGQMDAVPVCAEIVPVLLRQFEKGKGTAASMYFSAIVLERVAHASDGAAMIAKSDLDAVVHAMTTSAPQSKDDARPETQLSVYLTSLILNIWRYFASSHCDGYTILFSQVLVPVFDLIGIESGTEGNLCIIKRMFLEMLRHIATFDDLKTSITSEQMLSLLQDMANTPGPLSDEAKSTLSSLSA